MGYREDSIQKCNSHILGKTKNPTPKVCTLDPKTPQEWGLDQGGLAWLLPSSGFLSTPTSPSTRCEHRAGWQQLGPGGWPEVTVTELPGTCYYSSWGQSGEQGQAGSSCPPISCPLQGFSLIPSLGLPAKPPIQLQCLPCLSQGLSNISQSPSPDLLTAREKVWVQAGGEGVRSHMMEALSLSFLL